MALTFNSPLVRPVNFTFSEYASMNFDDAEEAHRGTKFVLARKNTDGDKNTRDSDQTSSTRRTAKILSEFHSFSHNAVHKWIRRLEEKLLILTEKKK